MKKIRLAIGILLIIGMQDCTYDTLPVPVDCEVEGIMIDEVNIEDAECGINNGVIEVIVVGGSGLYRYKVDDQSFQQEPYFENLGAGTHTIVVVDNNTCQTSTEVQINNKDGVNISLASEEAGCGGSEGSIIAQAIDGEPPYLFKVGNGEFSPNNIMNDLSPGLYTVTVKDETGCEASRTIRVKSGIDYATVISPIIQNNCAVNTCHNGNQFPDFRQFRNIHDNAAMIKQLTGDRTMPQEGSLTQSQIDAIACWVDDGALEN